MPRRLVFLLSAIKGFNSKVNSAMWPSLELVIFGPRHEKTCLCYMGKTKAQISLCSMISAFVVHCLDSIIPLLAIAEISRP